MAPLDRIAAVLRDDALDLVIANKNAPDQAVLSGPAAEIARAARRFDERGIATRPSTSRRRSTAGSSPLRGGRSPRRSARSRSTRRVSRSMRTPPAPSIPPTPTKRAALLADQLARPVEFVAQVEAMYRSGIRTFLEVGPDRKLTALVGAILGGREHAALAVDASRGQRGNLADLARALAQLAALGHPVRLPLWDEGADHHALPTPRRPASRA